MSSRPVLGGPAQPVVIMNGAQGSLAGPAMGAVSGVACGTKAAAGANTLIAAPGAGYRIVVYTAVIQNESTVQTTVFLQDQAMRWRRLLNGGELMTLAFDLSMPWLLNENTALTLNLSGANSHGYSIHYSIEPVG